LTTWYLVASLRKNGGRKKINIHRYLSNLVYGVNNYLMSNLCMCDCRIGTEHEKFGFEFDTLRPIKYNQISPLLNGIAERFHWDKIMEGDNIIGLKTVRPYIIFWFIFSL